MLFSVMFVSYIFFRVLLLCLLHVFCFLFFFFFFPKKMYWGTIFFCSRFYLSVIYFRVVFLFFILFGEFLCAMWNCGVSTKKKTTQLKKINKIKSPANFSFAAYDMEKLKISVEYVLFCVSRVISEKVFNTTLFPGGLPPQYWASSNRVNFGDRTRTGALRLIWSNPFVTKF